MLVALNLLLLLPLLQGAALVRLGQGCARGCSRAWAVRATLLLQLQLTGAVVESRARGYCCGGGAAGELGRRLAHARAGEEREGGGALG